MKYYLIDYENVNAAGLDGIEDLSTDSRIVLFYTKNSSKIDLGVFNLLRNTEGELAVIEVHHGKQALDIQLASYVGFLIGTEPADTEYYIVSKDKGYRNIQDFWSDRHIVLCTSLKEDSEIVDDPAETKSSGRSGARRGRRSSGRSGYSSAKAGQAEKSETKAESNSVERTDEGQHEKKGFKTKAEKNSRHERGARKAEAEEAPVNAAEDTSAAKEAAPETPEAAPKAAEPAAEQAAEEKKAPVVNAFAEAAALAAAMAAEKKEKAEKEAREKEAKEKEAKEEESKEKKSSSRKSAKKKTEKKADKADKKTEKKPAEKSAEKPAEEAPKQKASELRNEVNTEIQKILSKEGISGDVINATASFVSKNIGKDGYKQQIYRGIIKENGQKLGLEIYRLIKGVL